MTEEELYRENWLVSYEANIKGWLPSKGSDHVSKADGFDFLKKHDISFYNSDAAPGGVGGYSLLDKIAGRYT